MAVIGACVAAPTIAAIPTSAYASGCKPRPGKTWFSSTPNAPPVAAPMYSDGVNTPPDPPLPSVSDVAMIFPTASNARTCHAILPNTGRRTDRCPYPTRIPPLLHTSSPTASPPTAAFAHPGIFSRAIIASAPKKVRT